MLLRYTLRLLTLDQLQRAATLVCALETLRRDDPARLGPGATQRVGLWVGRTATANTLAEVGETITTWKTQRDDKKAPSPLPLTHCPWCGFELDPDTATLQPSKRAPTHVRVLCKNFRACDFGQGNKRHAEEGLPLVFHTTSRCTASCHRFWWRPLSSRWCPGAPRRACSSGAFTRARRYDVFTPMARYPRTAPR